MPDNDEFSGLTILDRLEQVLIKLETVSQKVTETKHLRNMGKGKSLNSLELLAYNSFWKLLEVRFNDKTRPWISKKFTHDYCDYLNDNSETPNTIKNFVTSVKDKIKLDEEVPNSMKVSINEDVHIKKLNNDIVVQIIFKYRLYEQLFKVNAHSNWLAGRTNVQPYNTILILLLVAQDEEEYEYLKNDLTLKGKGANNGDDLDDASFKTIESQSNDQSNQADDKDSASSRKNMSSKRKKMFASFTVLILVIFGFLFYNYGTFYVYTYQLQPMTPKDSVKVVFTNFLDGLPEGEGLEENLKFRYYNLVESDSLPIKIINSKEKVATPNQAISLGKKFDVDIVLYGTSGRMKHETLVRYQIVSSNIVLPIQLGDTINVENIASPRFAMNMVESMDMDGLIYWILGGYHMKHAEFKSAIKYFENARILSNSEIYSEAFILNCLFLNNEFKKLNSRIDQFMETFNDNIFAHEAVGVFKFLFNDFDGAIDHLEFAQKLDPHKANIYSPLLSSYIISGRCEEANNLVEEHYQYVGDSLNFLIDLALVSSNCGDNIKALNYILNAKKIGSTDKFLIDKWLLRLLFYNQNYSQVIAIDSNSYVSNAYKSPIGLREDELNAFYNIRGQAYMELQDIENAINCFMKMKIPQGIGNVDFKEGLLNLIMLRFENEEYEKCLKTSELLFPYLRNWHGPMNENYLTNTSISFNRTGLWNINSYSKVSVEYVQEALDYIINTYVVALYRFCLSDTSNSCMQDYIEQKIRNSPDEAYYYFIKSAIAINNNEYRMAVNFLDQFREKISPETTAIIDSLANKILSDLLDDREEFGNEDQYYNTLRVVTKGLNSIKESHIYYYFIGRSYLFFGVENVKMNELDSAIKYFDLSKDKASREVVLEKHPDVFFLSAAAAYHKGMTKKNALYIFENSKEYLLTDFKTYRNDAAAMCLVAQDTLNLPDSALFVRRKQGLFPD